MLQLPPAAAAPFHVRFERWNPQAGGGSMSSGAMRGAAPAAAATAVEVAMGATGSRGEARECKRWQTAAAAAAGGAEAERRVRGVRGVREEGWRRERGKRSGRWQRSAGEEAACCLRSADEGQGGAAGSRRQGRMGGAREWQRGGGDKLPVCSGLLSSLPYHTPCRPPATFLTPLLPHSPHLPSAAAPPSLASPFLSFLSGNGASPPGVASVAGMSASACEVRERGVWSEGVEKEEGERGSQQGQQSRGTRHHGGDGRGQYQITDVSEDPLLWAVARLRAECYAENQPYVRYVDSFVRRFAEQEFHSLRKRINGRFGRSISCSCLAAVCTGQGEGEAMDQQQQESMVASSAPMMTSSSAQRMTVETVIGSLDVSVRQLASWEILPGVEGRSDSFEWGGFASLLQSIASSSPPASTSSSRYAYVSNVCVARHKRRQGVASALLQAGLEIVRAWDVHEVYMHVATCNTGAHTLYHQLGFEVVEMPEEATQQTKANLAMGPTLLLRKTIHQKDGGRV